MKRLAGLLATLFLSLALPSAWAQQCAPLKVVVLSAPGGGADAMARLISQRLATRFNRTVIVENRAGAGGNLAAEYVAKAPKDGCTLLLTGNNFTLNPLIYDRAGYETKDFAPVHRATSGPPMLVAAANQPFKTLAEMVAYAKANPGKLTYGTSGIGSPNHLAMEMFLKAAGLNIAHAPYKGAGPAMTDTVAGILPMSMGSVASSAPFVTSGRVVPLAVSGPKRWPALPNVPTFVELGYPAASLLYWTGFLAPAGTPAAMLERTNREIGLVLDEPEVKETLLKLGYQPEPGTVQDFARFLVEDANLNRRLAQDLKLKAD